MSDEKFDTITVLESKTLLRADGRAAILLIGRRCPDERYAIAFEVNLENLGIIRAHIAKIDQFLSAQPGKT
jgi:hypothetical protein